MKRVCSHLLLLAQRRSVAKDQEHQVLLLAAQLGGDLAERQVIPQILHLHLDQLFSLESRGSDALAEVAEQGAAFRLARTGRAEVLLTVQADMLAKRREQNQTNPPCPERAAQQPQRWRLEAKASCTPSEHHQTLLTDRWHQVRMDDPR